MDRKSAAQIGKALKRAREGASLSQSALASKLDLPQSTISKLESGERSLAVEELNGYAQALGLSTGRLINYIDDFDSILDTWSITERELTEMVGENPSLRGMILGYAAEVKFRNIYLDGRTDLESWKDDDHDRLKKGDRRLSYRGKEIVVEVKSLQTKTVKFDPETGTFTGRSQVDASDRRMVTFSDGSQLETTLLARGEFDILAVNCFAFENTWRFVFALNKDLQTSQFKKYSELQQSELISSMQSVSLPPEDPFTEDFDEILERAYMEKQPPRPLDIDD